MPRIETRIHIKAEKKIVFDLSRSIDLHKISAAHTNEKAIAGRTTGLIELNESVTWRAKHFGFYQSLTSKVTEVENYDYFVDEMVSGAFSRFKHEHRFFDFNGGTTMIDFFDYDSPFGYFGRIADDLFLKKYMKALLERRNATIREFAESERWREIIGIK